MDEKLGGGGPWIGMGALQCRRRNSSTPLPVGMAPTRVTDRISATRRGPRIASPYQESPRGSLRSVARVPLPVTTIGWRAHAAFARHGPIRPLGAPSAYFTVGGELIWLGRVGASLHARAVLVPHVPEQLDGFALDQTQARVWRPTRRAPGLERAVLEAACRYFRKELSTLGEARGLGALLVGQNLDVSLERAVGPARLLARACGNDDPTAAVAAAEELIGLGAGLTPAGDDFVGGAFF